MAGFCALPEVRKRLQVGDHRRGGLVLPLPNVRERQGGAVLSALPQTAAIDAEEHHDTP